MEKGRKVKKDNGTTHISAVVDREMLNLCHLALRAQGKTLSREMRALIYGYAEMAKRMMKKASSKDTP